MPRNNKQVSLRNPSTHYDVLPFLTNLKTAYSQQTRELFGSLTRKISLLDFTYEAWPIIEPGKEFKSSKAIEAVTEHLEAVSKGVIRKLVVSIPPRHSKSSICSIIWPCWEWTQNPYTQWLTVSYALGLSVRFAVASRRLIQSEWYQKHWGSVFQLLKDQNAKSRYQNNFNGQRIATAMRASVTGENADRIVVDDAHNVTQSHSDKVRESTLEAFDKAISTRINDNKTGAIVVIAHRVHEEDVSGHILKGNEYEHLILPSEYDPNVKSKTSLGFQDWRKEKGELLWKERFDAEYLQAEKTRLGAYEYAAQHDQNPVPVGGALFKEKDLRFNPFLTPEQLSLLTFKRKHRHWDLAATVNSSSDYTASVLLGETFDNRFVVLNVTRERLTPGDAEKTILATALLDGYDVSITIEEEKGASGKHTTDYYRRSILKGFDCRPQALWADKETRARAFVGQVEAHNVYLAQGEWNDTYIAELIRFPKSTHKDQTDATSGAFRELMTSNHSTYQNISNKPSTYVPISSR